MNTSFRNEDLESRPSIVGLHYRVGKKIGEGSFGIIYEGLNVLDNRPVAIKFESKKSDAPQLRDEYKTYKLLAGSPGIPNVYYYGQEASYNCLVLDLLGLSLEDLFDACSRRFTIKTVSLLAKQMVTRVQTIHEKNLIYRDIKPDNFLIGRKDKNQTVYVVDFGMAKHYRDPKTKQHIPYKERKSLSGTARYMSINTHLGREQSRRDDLEALGNVFMYFLRGSLPWQGLKAATNKQKYEKIGEKKQQVSIKELCEGYPEEFASYIYYVRKLAFEDTPDYDYLRGLFTQVLQKLNEPEDYIFDWMLLPKKRDDDKNSITSTQTHPRQEPRARDTRSPHFSSSLGHLPMSGSPHAALGVNQVQYPALSSSVGRNGNTPANGNHAPFPSGNSRHPQYSGENSLRSTGGQGQNPLYAQGAHNGINGAANGGAHMSGSQSRPFMAMEEKRPKGFKRFFCCCFSSHKE